MMHLSFSSPPKRSNLPVNTFSKPVKHQKKKRIIYSVSIQPQIWDNDAIWVWRSLARVTLPLSSLPPTSGPPPNTGDTFQHCTAMDLSLGGASTVWGHLIPCLLCSQKNLNSKFFLFSFSSWCHLFPPLSVISPVGWLRLTPGWHRPNGIVCPDHLPHNSYCPPLPHSCQLSLSAHIISQLFASWAEFKYHLGVKRVNLCHLKDNVH